MSKDLVALRVFPNPGVGSQGTEGSLNLVHADPNTELNTGFNLRPWERLPNLVTISKTVGL